MLHNQGQQETGNSRNTMPQKYAPGNLQCLLSLHVGDMIDTARKDTADPLLAHPNKTVGQRKTNCNSFIHTGTQHEHTAGVVFTHSCAYINSITPIDSSVLTGKDEEVNCCTVLHEVYRSVLGVVAWTVLTRAELAAYVQAFQRRAHAPRVLDCERLNVVIRYMKTHKCGLRSVQLEHPPKLVSFTDAAF